MSIRPLLLASAGLLLSLGGLSCDSTGFLPDEETQPIIETVHLRLNGIEADGSGRDRVDILENMAGGCGACRTGAATGSLNAIEMLVYVTVQNVNATYEVAASLDFKGEVVFLRDDNGNIIGQFPPDEAFIAEIGRQEVVTTQRGTAAGVLRFPVRIHQMGFVLRCSGELNYLHDFSFFIANEDGRSDSIKFDLNIRDNADVLCASNNRCQNPTSC